MRGERSRSRASRGVTFGPEASSTPNRVGRLQVSASANGDAHFLPMPAQIPNPDPTAFATDKQGRLPSGMVGGPGVRVVSS